MMNKFLKRTALVTVLALGLSGCNLIGEMVEVPPASIGMVLGPNGYQGDLIPPSRFRLSSCVVISCTYNYLRAT